MGQQIRTLQALRGVACLGVVLFHLANWESKAAPQFTMASSPWQVGWVGVDLFFVLSGFIITWTQDKNLGRPAALGSYLGRRLWRIYSVYWACWIAAAIAYLIFWRVPIGNHSGFAACVKQLVLWPWGCGEHYSPVAWSLSYEVMFYVLFGAFIIVPQRWFVRVLACWTAVVAANMLLPPPADGPTWLPIAPLTFEFLMGCWTAVAYRRFAAGIVPVLLIGLVGLTAGTVCLCGWIAPGGPWRAAILAPPAGMIVYGLAGLERVGRFRPPNWLCRTGDASYSIYLTHWTAGSLVVSKTLRWSHTLPAHAFWAALMFGAMIGCGFVCYFVAERPLIELGRRRFAARGKTTPAAPEKPSARAA